MFFSMTKSKLKTFIILNTLGLQFAYFCLNHYLGRMLSTWPTGFCVGICGMAVSGHDPQRIRDKLSLISAVLFHPTAL